MCLLAGVDARLDAQGLATLRAGHHALLRFRLVVVGVHVGRDQALVVVRQTQRQAGVDAVGPHAPAALAFL